MVDQLWGGIKGRWRCEGKDIEEERKSHFFILVWEKYGSRVSLESAEEHR